MGSRPWTWALLACLLLAGSDVRADETPSPPAAVERPPSRPVPVQGWHEAYDSHVRKEVLRAPALLEMPASRVQDLCPRWTVMGPDERRQLFADLLFAMAGAESGRDRVAMNQETALVDRATGRRVVDRVTGKPIVSEGLLQLSYADMLAHPSSGDLGCAFEWPGDQAAFLADLEASRGRRSFRSSHPERSILDPYRQLTCAIHILERLVRRHPSASLVRAAGSYWSTMRPRRHGHVRLIRELRARNAACYRS